MGDHAQQDSPHHDNEDRQEDRVHRRHDVYFDAGADDQRNLFIADGSWQFIRARRRRLGPLRDSISDSMSDSTVQDPNRDLDHFRGETHADAPRHVGI